MHPVFISFYLWCIYENSIVSLTLQIFCTFPFNFTIKALPSLIPVGGVQYDCMENNPTVCPPDSHHFAPWYTILLYCKSLTKINHCFRCNRGSNGLPGNDNWRCGVACISLALRSSDSIGTNIQRYFRNTLLDISHAVSRCSFGWSFNALRQSVNSQRLFVF